MRRDAVPDPHLFLRRRAAGLLLVLGCSLATSCGLADGGPPPDPGPTSGSVVPATMHLPHTDGADLLSGSASPVPPGLRESGRRACDGPCVTPFGSRLGVADGVEARSNCVSTCLHLEFSFVERGSGQIQVAREPPDPARFEYAGLTYQCVEYARRWWIRNRGLTFGDVPTAADIFGLTAGLRLPGHEPVQLGRSLNAVARRPPERGDLVIYAADPADPEWRFGHVAVVVAVDQEQGWVALAEENYDNRLWREAADYARRIQLFAVGGRYTLIDVAPGEQGHADGGRIAGWVYPLTANPDMVDDVGGSAR